MALRDTPIAAEATDIVARTMGREADARSAVHLPELGRAVEQPVLLLLGETSPPWASAITSSLARVLAAPHLVVLPGEGHEAVGGPLLILSFVLILFDVTTTGQDSRA